MNIKSLSIALGLVTAVASGTAFAGDEYVMNQNLPAPATVSAVRAAPERTVAAADEYQRNLNSVAVAGSGLQRAQVVAEAVEARRLGLLVSGEGAAPVPTAAQLERIHLAGLRVVNRTATGE